VFALAVIVIGSLTPGYDQWSDAVSRLASPGEPWALAARAAFAAYGLLVAAGASTLRQYAGHQRHKLARCLTLYGVACVVCGRGTEGPARDGAYRREPGARGGRGPGRRASHWRHDAGIQVRPDPGNPALAAAAMALLTGLTAVILRYTWGTQVYGISERVLLGLGMCWISALAARALIASTPDAAAG